MKKSFLILLMSLFFAAPIFYSCGKTNILADTADASTLQTAENSILNKDYDKAILILTTYLTTNPTNYFARSMLANCYMLKAGINFADIAVSISNNLTTASNNLYLILNSLPKGTTSNLSYLNLASAQMALIPASAWGTEHYMENMTINMAIAFLTVSKTAVNSSGAITASGILALALDSTSISTICTSISTVRSNLTSVGAVAGSGTGLGKIMDISTSIAPTYASCTSGLATYITGNM